MPQDGINIFLRVALGSPNLLDGLLYVIKHSNQSDDSEWSDIWTDWLNRLREDAEALLVKIDEAKEEKRSAGLEKEEIDQYVEYLRSSVKPKKKILNLLREAFGKYRPDTTMAFDPKSCKVVRTDMHPKNATNEQLIAVILCAAIDTGDWRYLRRCREPKCAKNFFDSMPHGGRVKRYCSERHGAAHRARLRRGGE